MFGYDLPVSCAKLDVVSGEGACGDEREEENEVEDDDSTASSRSFGGARSSLCLSKA